MKGTDLKVQFNELSQLHMAMQLTSLPRQNVSFAPKTFLFLLPVYLPLAPGKHHSDFFQQR